jgi:hypothetical protein
MVMRNESGIKVIYAIQDIIALMIILRICEERNTGHNSTLRRFHPECGNGEEGNTPCVLEARDADAHVHRKTFAGGPT